MFAYLDSVYFETCAHDILSVKDCVNDRLCQLWILLHLGSVYLGLCPYRTVYLGSCPLCTLLTWFLIDFESVYLGVWLNFNWPMLDCIHYWFCQLWVLPKWGSVYLGIIPAGCLSTWSPSTLESGHMTCCPCRIVSAIGSVNSGFCSRLVLSTCDSVQLGVCLLGFFPLGSLATCNYAHLELYPLLVLSTLDSD